MKLLALDTSTEACSTALICDGEIIFRHEQAPRKHADLILSMLDELLAEAEIKLAQLDAIAFGRGPGSFTGVRIAAAVTQGIAFSADKPVVPVSTLASVAQQVMDEQDESYVLTALDARMGEVYWAGWGKNKNGFAENVIPESVLPPEKVLKPNKNNWTGAGNGWSVYEETLTEKLDGNLSNIYSDITPHAVSIVRLSEQYFNAGLAVPAEKALPVYLRNKVAEKSRTKRQTPLP